MAEHTLEKTIVMLKVEKHENTYHYVSFVLYFLLSLRFMFTKSFYTITLMPLYLFFHMEDKIEKARKVWIKWLPTYHALTCLMPACLPCPDFMLMI